MIRSQIQLLVALGVILLSGGLFWLGISGFISGEIDIPSRFESGVFSAAASPIAYWLSVCFYLGGGAFLARVAYRNFKEAVSSS